MNTSIRESNHLIKMDNNSEDSNDSTISSISFIDSDDVFNVLSDSSNESFNIDNEIKQNNEIGQRVEEFIFKNNLQFKKEQSPYITKDTNKIIFNQPNYGTINFDQTGESILIEVENILNEPKSTDIDENSLFEEEIEKKIDKRKQPPIPFLPNKKLMKNYNCNVFKHPNNQPTPCKYEHCSAYLYKSEMIDNLYCTYECKKSDSEQSENSTESVIVELKEYSNLPKITVINQNHFFGGFEKPIGKRKLPSILFQPNKQITFNYPDNRAKIKEISSKSLTKVNIDNDCKFESNFDHKTPILCKNKNCGICLPKSELFDNLYCTLECKNLNLEQTKQSINPKNISCELLKTLTVGQSPFIENLSGKRKQPFEPLLPNKIFLAECWNDCDNLNAFYCKSSTDVHTDDHFQYSFKCNNVQLGKTEDLKVSVIELKESATLMTNNDYLDEVKNIVPLFESTDELEQLEKSYQKLSIS